MVLRIQNRSNSRLCTVRRIFILLCCTSTAVLYCCFCILKSEDTTLLVTSTSMNTPKPSTSTMLIPMAEEVIIPFPRWGSDNITIPIIVSFYKETLYNSSVTTIWPKRRQKLHSDLFHIVTANGIYSSSVLYQRISKSIQEERVQPMIETMNEAIVYLMNYDTNQQLQQRREKQQQQQQHINHHQNQNQTVLNTPSTTARVRWPNLRRYVVSDNIGFPFFTFVGDYVDCSHHKLQQLRVTTDANTTVLLLTNLSIPILTVAAIANSTQCNYSFPMPTYATIVHSRRQQSQLHIQPETSSRNRTTMSRQQSLDWNTRMKEWSEQYPSETKIRKVVWRGGLTGPIQNYTSIRWRLPFTANMYEKSLSSRTNNSRGNNNSLFDVGLTHIPARHKKYRTQMNLSQVGGLVPEISPMESFQQYYAILDIDGNSWSSRFGLLLCYNSVILKVDARFVDYFYINPSTDRLVPWKHYVPIKYDLSDLVSVARYVLDPVNAQQIQAIIRSANEWCAKRMTINSIIEDYLDIWDKYIDLLRSSDPNWDVLWKQAKDNILSTNNTTGDLQLLIPT